MKIVLLSLFALTLMILILFYEHTQIVKKMKELTYQKETFVNFVDEENTINETLKRINEGGNGTISSAICDGTDISNKPQNIDTLNELCNTLNTNMSRMTDNVLNYYNLL